jgi:hypothetical protein
MQHITATDAAGNLIALTLFGLIPRLQGGDLSIISEIAKLSPAALLAFILLAIWRGELVPKGTLERLNAEYQAALTARDKRLEIVMSDHLRAMEQIDRERQREREQSQASYAAMREHYETRLAEHAAILGENTALLKRMADQMNERPQKVA